MNRDTRGFRHHARPGCPALRMVALLGVAAALAFTGLQGSGPVGSRLLFQTAPDSRARVVGRATIGQWTCETSTILAQIEPGPRLEALTRRVLENRVVDGAIINCVPHAAVGGTGAPFALISIPVASLQPDKPGMRSDILRALRAEEAPLIVFSLTAVREITVLTRAPGALGRYRVIVSGDLTLAGRTRPIELAAEVVQETPVRFRIAAAPVIRMADFGITPPTALFGLIRVDETVTVSFDLKLLAAEGSTRASPRVTTAE